MSETHRSLQLALPADQGVEHLHSSSPMLLDTTHAIGHCSNGRGRARRSRALRGQVDRQGCPSFKVLTQLQEAWRQSDESGDACWLTPRRRRGATGTEDGRDHILGAGAPLVNFWRFGGVAPPPPTLDARLSIGRLPGKVVPVRSGVVWTPAI